jgi:hypothetical protein
MMQNLVGLFLGSRDGIEALIFAPTMLLFSGALGVAAFSWCLLTWKRHRGAVWAAIICGVILVLVAAASYVGPQLIASPPLNFRPVQFTIWMAFYAALAFWTSRLVAPRR